MQIFLPEQQLLFYNKIFPKSRIHNDLLWIRKNSTTAKVNQPTTQRLPPLHTSRTNNADHHHPDDEHNNDEDHQDFYHHYHHDHDHHHILTKKRLLLFVN